MTCRQCQLVEMARIQREGTVDVYRCPKCGAIQRVTPQQRAQAQQAKLSTPQ